jgi:hypothetical protein
MGWSWLLAQAVKTTATTIVMIIFNITEECKLKTCPRSVSAADFQIFFMQGGNAQGQGLIRI